MFSVAKPEPQAVAAAPIVVEDGVIEEARRRQRRRRTAIFAAALTALAAGLLAPLFYAGGGAVGPPAPLRPASSLTPLTGPPLSAATHLTLAVSENGGTVFLLDVDRRRARAVSGLGLQPGQLPQVTLTRRGSRLLASVTHAHCRPTCARPLSVFADRESQFLVSPTGSAHRIATFALTRHQETTQAFGSNATWVLTWPHRGPCTLRAQPGSHPLVRVSCGSPGPATAAGLWIVNGDVRMLVDPRTGRVRQRVRTSAGAEVTPLPDGLALESPTATFPSRLDLVDLATGARRRLRWPSVLHFGYQALPAPHGPLVALEIGDPAYPPPPKETVNQAADIWVLNTSTGAFTHVPGFPAIEFLKLSGVTWTADGRLVIAASGGGRTVVGLWKPGQKTLPIRSVPRLDGYSQVVALRR